MNKPRIVQKGNVKEGSFDVRIIESDGKTYYYHFLELKGENSVIHSNTPLNLKGETEILWDELPFEVKEEHYKNMYPYDDLDDYDKKCFLYGKEKADEIIAAEKEREKQKKEFLNKVAYQDKVCGYSVAEVIYSNIGPWESFEVIYKGTGSGKFRVNNKVITVENWKIVSVEEKAEYEEKRKAWGHRISQIAKAAGTSFDMATVVGNITNDTNAIEILKIVVERLNSDNFKAYMNRDIYYSRYNTDDMSLKYGIRDFLRDKVFSRSILIELNLSKKFCNAVKKILNNK